MAPLILQVDGNNAEPELNAVAAALDSTPVITWLAQQRKLGALDRTGLRRGLMMRMIWQVAYYTSTSLVANIDYLLGRSAWGNDVRATLAGDICAMRRGFAAAGHRLAYSNGPRKGYYVRGRPELDAQLVNRLVGAMAEVDPAQMAITRKLTPAQRFAQAMSLIDFANKVGAYRLRQRYPHLSEEEALYWTRQGKVRL